jgi:hypothetical protein
MTAGKDWYVELGVLMIKETLTVEGGNKYNLEKVVGKSLWIRENDLKVITELPE